MLTYKAGSAGGEVVQVGPKPPGTDCSVCEHRQNMPLDKRTFVCVACGMKLDRDVNESRNILGCGIVVAGRNMKPPVYPGMSGSICRRHVVRSLGQGAERYAELPVEHRST